jgi:hypothetical protein
VKKHQWGVNSHTEITVWDAKCENDSQISLSCCQRAFSKKFGRKNFGQPDPNFNILLSAIFLDENGKVLKEIGLATNRDTLDPIPFSQRISLPLNAVFMAFSYQGVACDLGRGRTSFWFNPIH